MDYNNQLPPSQVPPIPSVSSNLAKKRGINWPWTIAAIIVILAVAAFFVAVYVEVAARNSQLQGLLDSVDQDNAAALLENELLNGLSGLGGSAASTSSSTLADVPVKTKDSNRELAERLDRPHLGNVSSSLVIVEFADFECTHCLAEFPIIRAISNKYAKGILFIFRNYPVINDNSTVLAQAGLCANEQGKFWAFHDRLYSKQGQLTSLADIKNVAVMSGLNWNQLNDCVTKEKYKEKLMQDMADAVDLGVEGTPTFFVNGNKLEGVVPEATWDQIIAKSKEIIN